MAKQEQNTANTRNSSSISGDNKIVSLDSIDFDFDKLLNYKKTPNSITDESKIESYQSDSDKKQYYPMTNKKIIEDDTDRLIMYIAYARRQLMLSLLDDYGIYDYNLKKNTPKDLIEFPVDDLVIYDNIAYRESLENSISNANVPIGWNVASRGMELGGLIITPEMLEFVKEMRAIGRIPDTNIIRSEEKYELMLQAAEAIIGNDENFAGHPVMCLAGGFAGEMGWRFDEVIINEDERKRENDTDPVHGVGTLANCGEGWIGYTHWASKEKWIKQYGLPCAKDSATYNSTGVNIQNRQKLSSVAQGTHISTLSFEDAAKLLVAWMQDRTSAGKWIAKWPEVQNEEGAANEAMGASYMSKHGEGYAKQEKTWWDKAVFEGRRVMYTGGKEIKRSGFGCHIYMSMMFAYWIEYGVIPEGDPWDIDSSAKPRPDGNPIGPKDDNNKSTKSTNNKKK